MGEIQTKRGNVTKMTEGFVVENNEFFLLERRGNAPEIAVYRGLDPAVARIRALLKMNIDPKELALTKIMVKEESFLAQPIDWADIATKLIQNEE